MASAPRTLRVHAVLRLAVQAAIATCAFAIVWSMGSGRAEADPVNVAELVPAGAAGPSQTVEVTAPTLTSPVLTGRVQLQTQVGATITVNADGAAGPHIEAALRTPLEPAVIVVTTAAIPAVESTPDVPHLAVAGVQPAAPPTHTIGHPDVGPGAADGPAPADPTGGVGPQTAAAAEPTEQPPVIPEVAADPGANDDESRSVVPSNTDTTIGVGAAVAISSAAGSSPAALSPDDMVLDTTTLPTVMRADVDVAFSSSCNLVEISPD